MVSLLDMLGSGLLRIPNRVDDTWNSDYTARTGPVFGMAPEIGQPQLWTQRRQPSMEAYTSMPGRDNAATGSLPSMPSFASAPQFAQAPMQQAVQQQPVMPAQQPQSGGFMDYLGNNSNMLMALGAGIAQGGIGKGLQYASQTGLQEQAQANKRGNMAQSYNALVNMGVPKEFALQVVQSGNEALFKLAIEKYGKTSAPMSVEEKRSRGLDPSMPWHLGADNLPKLPEGVAQSKLEIQKDPAGNLTAVNPYTAQGTPVQGVATAGPKFDDVSSLRKEFLAQPPVKKFFEAVSPYQSMLRSAPMDTATADLDLINGLAKILDPDSAIKEGEFQTVKNAQSIPDRIKGEVQYLFEGKGKLSQGAREELMKIARNRVESYREAAQSEVGRYRDLAGRFKFAPEEVVRGFDETPVYKRPAEAPTEGAVAPQEGAIARNAKGDRIILKGGQWRPYNGK